MLLRSSRASGQLTKLALGIAGKALLGAGKKTLSFAGKHPGKILGGGLVAATTAPAISEGVRKSNTGLQPGYLQAANEGMVPSVPKV